MSLIAERGLQVRFLSIDSHERHWSARSQQNYSAGVAGALRLRQRQRGPNFMPVSLSNQM